MNISDALKLCINEEQKFKEEQLENKISESANAK